MDSQKGNVLILILVGVLSLVGIAVGAYCYQFLPVNDELRLQSVIAPTIAPKTAENPDNSGKVDTWNAFKDPLGRYSFSYPNVGLRDLSSNQIKGGVTHIAVGTIYEGPQTDDVFQRAFYLTIKTEINLSNKTIAQIERELQNRKIDINTNSYYSASDIKPYSNGQINGLIYREDYDNGDQESSEMKIVCLHDGYVYTFAYSNLAHLAAPEGEQTVQKILANFKFLTTPSSATERTINITDWKFYSNTKHGYSFQYPPSWSLKGEEGWVLIESIEGISSSQTVDQMKNEESNGYIRINVMDNQGNLDLKTWFDQNETCGTTEFGCAPSSPKYLGLSKIYGYEVLMANWSLPGPLGEGIKVYYYSQGTNIYQFSFFYPANESSKKEFDQIYTGVLSSLKFSN